MERLAKILVLFLLIAAAGIVLAGRVFAGQAAGGPVILHARMPENGGWGQEVIQAEAGKPLHLRITSDDVRHSFSIGQMDFQTVTIEPGLWKDVTVTFDKPGRYTFYCSSWCGPEHWRMRGTIDVSGPAPTGIATEVTQPLYLALNIDVDAPHMAQNIPAAQPDPARGAKLAADLPVYASDRQTYLSSSPEALWKRLRGEASLSPLSDADLWDAVSYVWQQNTSPAQLEKGRALFAQNCAACHGETGAGDGVMVRGLPTPMPSMSDMMSGHAKTRPPNLNNPAQLLGASPALLEGKLLRGGMGTGMPMWGNIFTKEQLDALVSYLYTLIGYN